MLLALFLTAASAWASATAGTIRGWVCDEQGLPLPGARMTVKSPGLVGGALGLTTDENGEFRFEELPPGTYSVVTSWPGFGSVTRVVYVQVARVTQVSVELPFIGPVRAVSRDEVHERQRVKPVYPEAAREQGLSGYCSVTITIDTDGVPYRAEVTRCADVYSDASEKAAMSSRWYPYEEAGVAIPASFTYVDQFSFPILGTAGADVDSPPKPQTTSMNTDFLSRMGPVVNLDAAGPGGAWISDPDCGAHGHRTASGAAYVHDSTMVANGGPDQGHWFASGAEFAPACLVLNGTPRALVEPGPSTLESVYSQLPGVTRGSFAGTMAGDVTVMVDGVVVDQRGFLGR